MNDIADNKAEHRFELTVEGHLAAAYYTRAGGIITFVHTEVPPELGGKGVGSRLVKGALDLVRSEGTESGRGVPVRQRLDRQAPGLCRPAEGVRSRYSAPSFCRPSCAVRRFGLISRALRKSAIAPCLSPSRILAWPRLFQE